jgi:predicted RNase H-like nuclease (RuvC/YqgF family)
MSETGRPETRKPHEIIRDLISQNAALRTKCGNYKRALKQLQRAYDARSARAREAANVDAYVAKLQNDVMDLRQMASNQEKELARLSSEHCGCLHGLPSESTG